MNILVEAFPSAILIDGQEYEIDVDFRTCIRIILAFEDNDLTAIEKQALLIENLYKVQPHNLQEAFRKGIKFLDGGTEEHGEEEKEEVLRLYSFAKDSNFIFAAFRQTHGIDLEKEDMHWWKFMALFSDLGADTTFCNLVGLRKRVKTGKATKEEKVLARELGDLVTLEEIDTRTIEEKEAEATFMKLVMEGANKA